MATILPEMYDEAVCAGQFNQDGGGQWVGIGPPTPPA